jgi:hypothetical protein
MWKVVVASAVLTLAAGSVFPWFIKPPQDWQEVATRFGSVTVDQDRSLLFRGRKLTPSVDGNNSLGLNNPIQIGDTDVVLVVDNGGTACPAMYYFVTVSKTGAQATKPFGTCSDLASVKQIGNSIRVIMPGYRGPHEPESAQLRASRQQHVFTFRAGVVTSRSPKGTRGR